ncbi:hypothetical protein ORJ04_18810 [Rheinheimera baltica]|uniref:IrrE N-terminal-like domain-containing protein n=1 Tax=Rheinheimera baltica TaxID=67576 RepID=A0ABT9I3P6_9GAMM|nr:hypothetical protein [Rheinheimera baltica]MDP5138005.1 hypothetical protein [Rheinheimera baltica]
MMTDELRKILDFFNTIGINWKFQSLQKAGFLPGVQIENGCLRIAPEQLANPGDLLHEAGHIAIMPTASRHFLQDDVRISAGQGAAEEMAAIAWSWAALMALQLPPEFLFHPDGYKGSSAAYITAFCEQGGFGHPLLSWYGLCLPAGQADGYPKMQCWLRA